MAGRVIVSVRDLRVWFPIRRSFIDIILRRPQLYVRAVDGVTFDIHEGEMFCLVGESGCGKTTTGRAILRLIEPENIHSGRILLRPSEEVLEKAKRLDPKAVDEELGMIDVYAVRRKEVLKMIRREIQVVFQDPYGSLNPRYSVRQILEEPLIIHGLGSESERLERIRKALEVVKLTPPEEFMTRFPHNLSGGQRQRVAIARALILDPKFIVADEPVSMLDVSIRAEILEILLSLKEKFNIALLFITHDLALAKHICDRIAIMYLGRIVEIGPAERVIDNPLHPYTRALIAAIPEPDPENRKILRSVPIKGEVPSAVNIPEGCRFRPRCVAYDSAEVSIKRRCEQSEPGYYEVEPGHYVSCWLYAK